MIKGKMSLQATIIILVCFVVILSLVVTGLLINNTEAEVTRNNQGEKAIQVARMMAKMPLVIQSLEGGNQEASLQRFTNDIKNSTNMQFIVVMDMQGIRKTHPDPSKVGKKFVGGDESYVLKGKEHISVSKGTLGQSLRAFTPVYDEQKHQIGAVSVGISLQNVNQAIDKNQFIIILGTVFGLLAGIVGAVILARYIKKILFNLEPQAIAELLEEKSAMLDSVREGIIAVDKNSQIKLVNRTAMELFKRAGLNSNPIGLNIHDYMPASRLERVLNSGKSEYNEEQNLNGFTILVNCVPVIINNNTVGAIATFRDKTEMKQLAEQLTGVKTYADALRAQSHEFMNRMHVIIGMLHMKNYEQLSTYIHELTSHQVSEIRSITSKIKDPVLAGLLLAKLSYSREMGVDLSVTINNEIPEFNNHDISHQMITIIGNLIDNAIDAVVGTAESNKIDLKFYKIENELVVNITDTGSGIDIANFDQIYQKGFSTKGENRGFGLYLVKQSIEHVKGSIVMTSNKDQGTRFTVHIPYELEDN